MARLIAVSIDCQNETVRRMFEEIVSRRRDYLITRGQGTGTADMLLLELNEGRPQQTFGHIRELLATSPDLEVFLTASRTDTQTVLEAFRVGVREFLPQPLTRQEVEPALARFEERFNGRVSGSEMESGKVVSVIGARGAVGASTMAANLAAAMQRESAVLVDLDLHGGDLGLFLDLQASQGFKQLSNDISRLDEMIVRSSLVQHSSGLHLLTSGSEGFSETRLAPGSAMRVIGLLRSMHRHVIVDCGHVLEPAVQEALDCSDQIIVVTTLALPVIRRTRRLLQTLGAAHYEAGKVSVVANRYTHDRKELLGETESMLGVRMAGLIPNDYSTASEALDRGKPLAIMAPKTAIGQWYLQEAGRLLGTQPAATGTISGKDRSKNGSFLSRYLPGFALETSRKSSVI